MFWFFKGGGGICQGISWLVAWGNRHLSSSLPLIIFLTHSLNQLIQMSMANFRLPLSRLPIMLRCCNTNEQKLEQVLLVNFMQ